MTHSIYTGQGYLLNDNSASGGTREEADMLGCKHCQALIKKTDWQTKGGMCMACSAPICHSCATRTVKFGCEGPYEKSIERAVEDQYRLTQNSRILGI